MNPLDDLPEVSRVGSRHVLVTGCAKSGTLALVRALRRLGIDARHESVYGRKTIENPGLMVWPETPIVEVSWEAAPYLAAQSFPRMAGVFHLVRNVRDQVVSNINFALREEHWWVDYMRSWTSMNRRDTYLEQALTYWYEWNQMIIDSRIERSCRVLFTEDMAANVFKIVDTHGVDVSLEECEEACRFDYREHVHGVRDRAGDDATWAEEFDMREDAIHLAESLYAQLRCEMGFSE